MKNRRILAACLLVSLMTAAGVSAAAQPGMPMDRQAPGTPLSNMPGVMGGPMPGMMTGPLGDQMPGIMMGGRPGMSGMGAMMTGGCPMMGAMTGVLTPQQHMKMHAEMMQAMGQIMEKYATQAEKGPN